MLQNDSGGERHRITKNIKKESKKIAHSGTAGSGIIRCFFLFLSLGLSLLVLLAAGNYETVSPDLRPGLTVLVRATWRC
jgi:hypothetical protein